MLALLAVCSTAQADDKKKAAEPQTKTEPSEKPSDPVAAYFAQLESMKLIDATSGNIDTLRHELQVAEDLLKDGAFANAAVSLYAIVRSPRYDALTDFVEYQNAEYDLGVALARSGAYGSALDALEAVLRRGPAAQYWGPAHRRAVDNALETRDHAGVLARLESIKTSDPIPPNAAGERAYLRGRAAYDAGKFVDAEGELVTVSKKSRLYSSAVYLRGVIRAKRGQFKESAEAMCEIAGTPDNDKFTFVVDERYFTIKDLARLGLGRIAHEAGEYDDAYYHYFQIPDDSAYLPDALFEASWSMYQKRELATSRDLVHELLTTFPTAPEWPEASLLAGYVELADCKFDDSQHWYDQLSVARLDPIVAEIDKIKGDPTARKDLFASALTKYREVKQTGEVTSKKPDGPPVARTPRDEVLALLRLDPQFVRLSEAIAGAHELANSSGAVVQTWEALGKRVSETKVAAVSGDPGDKQAVVDANATVDDFRRLGEAVLDQKADIARAKAAGTMPADVADAEIARLDELHGKVKAAEGKAVTAAQTAAKQISDTATPQLRPMLETDLADAQRLARSARELANKLDAAGDKLAQAAVERLYIDTRKVLDKAKLGKVDAVIGQKRKLDIQVQDLASGRFPEELIGRMWNASLIGDDEEYWPWQGEYWSDEYEGFR